MQREDAQQYPWWRYVGDPEILLSGKYPDTVRHIAIRAQFCQLMLRDARIELAVNKVSRRRVEEAAWHFVAADGGVPQNGQNAAEEALRQALDSFSRRLFRALRQALEQFHTPHLPRGFLWPWLLHDLGTACGSWFLDQLAGKDVLEPERMLLEYGAIDPVRPRLAPEPQRPGESDSEFIARVRKMAKRRASTSGKLPSDVEVQHQWGQWFYRRHALGESVGELARERHDRVHAATGRRYGRATSVDGTPRANRCDCRSTVNYGLKQARRLLEDFPSHGVK